MKTHNKALFKYSVLALGIASILMPSTAIFAQEAAKVDREIETIQITATRRSSSVQEAPLNITALDGDVMKDQNIAGLEDVARWVPGLTISEQGGRDGPSIIVRGLNTNSSERASDAGTVATYLGELPLDADIRLTDVQRVEVLIGPQGTLYGAGTLGGAIRYMLNAPEFGITEGRITGDVFTLNNSSGTGGEFGFVFNTPLIDDELALRVSLNHYDTPGFVDYDYVVKQPGVSIPDPDWNDQSAIDANLKSVKDVNDEQINTARISLLWEPNDTFEATLNYFYQKQENGGNSTVQYDALSSQNPLKPLIGQYSSGYRYEEPNEKIDDLLSLEMTVDLGFADLVSATGRSTFERLGQRDQTDLLYNIYSGYADFPAFAAFTRDTSDNSDFVQEIRLVSKGDSAFSWIAGYYYNKSETLVENLEFTPGLTDFWFGGEYVNIERDLEYIAISTSEDTESAFFGEVSYQFNEALTVTVGARFYEYDLFSSSDNHAPFFNGEIASRDELDFIDVPAEGDGSLFKFNASYQFNRDVMGYVTVSEGFRLGGANGLVPCTGGPDQAQVCALPNEENYTPDTTTNMELGFKSTWMKNRLHLNAALFNVDWEDAQVAAVTQNGFENITSNAGAANSKGVEISTRAILSDNFTAYGSYSYAKAELTEDAPFLFDTFLDDDDNRILPIQDFYDGKDGDRLPGAPEHQFSVGINYETEVLDGKTLNINYGLTAQSDVYTKVGLKADGEVLAGYSLSNFSAQLAGDDWTATFYIDNMFDKYANTSVRRDKSWAGMARFESENKSLPELQRVYGHYITKPRTIGLKFSYNFEM